MTTAATLAPVIDPVGLESAARNPVRGLRAAALNGPRILRDALLIVALLVLNKGGLVGTIAFFIVLVLMLLHSPAAAFKAIAICSLGLMINQAFVPKTFLWTPARLILPFLALIRFSGDLSALKASLFSKPWYVAFLVFVLTMAVGSVVSGWFTHIALLKLFNFWAAVTAILSGACVLRAKRIDISEWCVSLIFAATMFGVASVLFGVGRNFRMVATSTGGLVEAGGFNGAFMHPNLHATYATLFVIYLLSIWILGAYRKTWLVVPGVIAWLIFMAWSGSRTSIISSTLGAACLIAYARPFRNRQGWRLSLNIKRSTLFLIFLATSGGLISLDAATDASIRKSLTRFINKGGSSSEETVLDAEQIFSSRTRLVQDSWVNFQNNPVFGIGFGVAKTEAFASTATLLSAPAEKGFLPTAMLEEGGLLGAATFLLFLVAFAGMLLRERNVAGLVVFIAFLATNLGEVTIFSPGGAGFFGWTMIGAAMILGDHCWRLRPS